MQTKKNAIEQTILDCAREEFVIHGYENASMRTIAKKANTSLGNIYHYFPNKKAILDTLLLPVILQIDRFLQAHIAENVKITSIQEINTVLENMNFNDNEWKAILSKEFVILMETKEIDYVKQRDILLRTFRTHIAGHMKCNSPDNHFVIIVTKMVTDCIIHLIKCGECTKQKKKEVINMFSMLCRCVAVHDLADETDDTIQENN